MKKGQKNTRKRLNSLILLVAFTAVMLIVSTYAWFSAQKNVTISNIKGTVKVAEGLQISLDAEHWSQEIDLENPKLGTGFTLVTPYEGGQNIIPSELIPVSSTGSSASTDGIGQEKWKFYRGVNVNGIDLYDIKQVDETDYLAAEDKSTILATDVEKFPGYIAVDLFLQNSSASGITVDTLQLNSTSSLVLQNTALNTTGLQNTIRVGFALYNSDATDNKVDISLGTPSTYIAATGNSQKIKDIAIWEPNANAHVSSIVTNNNRITWNAAATDAQGYLGDGTKTEFTAENYIPTYALTAASKSTASGPESFTLDGATKYGIVDIYDWNTSIEDTGLEKQITLQTASGTNLTGTTDLLSITTPATTVLPTPSGTAVKFQIPANQVCRMRMYVWLEGQDVDCINLASHGGGIALNLGIMKPGSDGAGAGG